MDDEIVRNLMNKKRLGHSNIEFSTLHESLREADEEDEELDIPEEEEESEDIPDEEAAPAEEGEENSEEGEEETKEETPEKSKNVNPLDNNYAINFKLGDKVVITYTSGASSEISGVIEGYDKEGFYRVKCKDGSILNGVTDILLNNLVDTKHETRCVCGNTEFVQENGYLVCDRCGRYIQDSPKLGESADPLVVADDSRPRGKRVIRSEAHPMSTAIKPSISETIRRAFRGKSIKEDYDEEEEEEENEYPKNIPAEYHDLYDKLNNQFWTRLPELKEDIEDLGYSVDEINGEYVVVMSEEYEEHALQIFIEGTSRTFTLDFNRARII